jgi:hypothetical protein
MSCLRFPHSRSGGHTVSEHNDGSSFRAFETAIHSDPVDGDVPGGPRLSSGHHKLEGIDNRIAQLASASCSGIPDRPLKCPQAVSALITSIPGNRACHVGDLMIWP